MILHFHVTGNKRKAMVKAIEDVTKIKATYLKLPSCAYQIGKYHVGKNGELTIPKSLPEQNRVIEACVLACGVEPEEWMNSSESQSSSNLANLSEMIVSVPKEKVDIEKLQALIHSKSSLIKKALGIDNLIIEIKDETVVFPWIDKTKSEEWIQSCMKFIMSLCKMSLKLNRVQSKEKIVTNEKYAFRCFLLRLGFIGDEYKKDRKILLQNLSGSSAFKDLPQVGGIENENK